MVQYRRIYCRTLKRYDRYIMLEALKKWTGLTRDSAYVNDEFDFENMRTSLYMSCVIIALEIWMIFSAIEGVITGERLRSSKWLLSHVALYLLLIAVAAAVFVHSVNCLKKKKNSHVLSQALFGIFSLTCIMFGTYISYHDYTKGEQLFCERAQGYLFGRPMNKDDLTEYIKSGKLAVVDE